MENTFRAVPAAAAVPPVVKVPPPRAASLAEHAVRYAGERHWDVLPGAWLEDGGGVLRCSCALPACDAPGAHPTRPDWHGQVTGSAATARRLWEEHPRASVLLPTGRLFDVIEIAEAAGCLALARLERSGPPPGPVAVTPLGTLQFYVRAGDAPRVPGLLRQTGWGQAVGDLRTRGDGEWVAAPPTRVGTRGSAVRWVRRPVPGPGGMPEAAALLPALAYACAQTREV
ncbi:bifunctional DNA primase/polymerase [Streptomyces sp. RFCAC02]|uniref:bifunctional DNA primase/polymerase n=1 Tax=Streptomyces sp. RFCAC02 TaxID=2499143 RepID=UPI001022736A|nr:bifunctional DNA primase/polymerase [Streptomyces sp. RFCAC02]